MLFCAWLIMVNYYLVPANFYLKIIFIKLMLCRFAPNRLLNFPPLSLSLALPVNAASRDYFGWLGKSSNSVQFYLSKKILIFCTKAIVTVQLQRLFGVAYSFFTVPTFQISTKKLSLASMKVEVKNRTSSRVYIPKNELEMKWKK